MKQFSELVNVLGTATKTNEKLFALEQYFATADDKDKVWVIALFSGRRPKRAVNSNQLQTWCSEITGLPRWLFEECYHTVGDLAETISLMLPDNKNDNIDYALYYYIETLINIGKEEELIKKEFIISVWNTLSANEIFVFNKLITGSFRIGISQKSMVNALSKSVNVSPSVIAHRISGNWDPSITSFNDLLSEDAALKDISKPYPFYLAYPLEDNPEILGDPRDWIAEWKWDGIRGQVIHRNKEFFVWSRGEELITERFPEYRILKELLPQGTVIDGEILPYKGTMPLPFNILQTRIGRKNITKKKLEEAPVVFFVYDLLEYQNVDWRLKTMLERRNQLEKIVEKINHPVLKISPVINFYSWIDLAETRRHSREMGSEGLMLKRKNSAYQVGRKIGDWWKWKIDPLTIDAVMIYAQKGHGRRSNLYTDYTFAVKDGDKLVSFAKAYSGLTDKEFAQIDYFVKQNSIEKFGPVRTVKPELVFEIAFEGIAKSNRHKSGVALRFPRISRWRKDKTVAEINTLDDLKKMLNVYGK